MAKCEVCHVEMYESSNGSFCCRNFDCPPGTEKKHQDSWKLRDLYRPILLKQPSNVFTVEELQAILNPDSGEYIGPRLAAMAKRLRITKAEAMPFKIAEDQANCSHWFDGDKCHSCGKLKEKTT